MGRQGRLWVCSRAVCCLVWPLEGASGPELAPPRLVTVPATTSWSQGRGLSGSVQGSSSSQWSLFPSPSCLQSHPVPTPVTSSSYSLHGESGQGAGWEWPGHSSLQWPLPCPPLPWDHPVPFPVLLFLWPLTPSSFLPGFAGHTRCPVSPFPKPLGTRGVGGGEETYRELERGVGRQEIKTEGHTHRLTETERQRNRVRKRDKEVETKTEIETE